jgi:hypothetical protein
MSASAVPHRDHFGSATAQIVIVRNSSDDTQTRQIKIFLDGENQGELMFGDSMTLEVSSGAHTIRVDNTWNRKDLALEIHAGQNLRFLTKSSAGKFAWFLLGFLGAGPMRVSIEPLPSRS